MIKYITITLFFLLSSFMVHAQSNGCDGSRYIDDIFSEVKITSNIAYGNNTTIGGRNRTFYMDIYEPKNDQMTARPTVILAHGGSFIGGSKNEFVRLGSDLAKKGYVVASISYRLIDGLILDSIGMSEGVVMAIGDMRAAVRYLKNNATTSNDYGINADIIFAGGTSAGGVMASHVGMLDADDVLPDYLNEHIIKHGGLEGNTNDITNVNSTVVGVLNYSGALARANWIDTNDPPFLSVHDELDETVPCGYGRVGAVWFPAYLYGSCAMNTRAIEQGVQNDITIYPGDGHVSYMFDEHYDEVVVKSSIFMENVICEQLVDVDDAQTLTFAIGPNPAYDKIRIQGVPGGQLKYIVYDNFGHTVRHDQFQGDLTIKVSSLPTGIYAIKIMSEEGREGSQFFIKN